jgi:hypothetical protein
MDTFRADASPQPDDFDGNMPRFVGMHSIDIGPPSQGSMPPISVPSNSANVPKQPAPSPSSSGFKSWWIPALVVGGLLRVAINSATNPTIPPPNPVQVDAEMRRFTESLQSMPASQRALMKVYECEAIIGMDPKNADAYNRRAWLLATYPDAIVRDGKKAVADATKACTLTNWQNSAYLETLAAAHAEAGDFKKAIETQEKAQQGRSPNDKAKRDVRLDLYKKGQPYRDLVMQAAYSPRSVLPPYGFAPQAK